MHSPSLDWLDLLPDLRVPGVPGVPAQKTATFSGTPQKVAGVPGVPDAARNTSEHLALVPGVPAKPLIRREEHREHLGTPEIREGAGDLPSDILAGLDRLRTEPGPRISNPAAWTEIVADALRLADEGWGAKALALGWSPLELWGASPAIGGDPERDGIAVWLSSRRVLLVDAKSVIATRDRVRSLFYRFDAAKNVPLWKLRDVQRERMRGGQGGA